MALIDVLIPAYNAAATLREAVDSIRAQTVSDVRIIVVDDGSTDETPSILAALAKEEPRLHIVTQSNRGIVEARNAALRHCESEFIACLDADDIAFPGRFARQIDYLRSHPDCVAVGGAVEHMDEHGASLRGLPQSGDPANADPSKAPALEPYIVHSTLMARRAAVEAAGGYRHVPNSEDSDLFWRLGERGTLVNLPEPLARYRVHTASASSSIVSGRVMAVGSQLGAISAQRRRAGREDLIFRFEMLAELKAARTLEAMAAAASQGLDAAESGRLRIAAGAKLMEMARYRPYELELSDCSFIREALPHAKLLTRQNQREVTWYITVTAARLMRKRLWREAVMLTPPQDYPIAGARALMSR
jgi:glycosyltransferase involved in cell wall biosynthesis